MTKLLSSYFSRLSRDRFFWICIISAFGFSALSMAMGIRRAELNPDISDYCTMDQIYFNLAPFLSLLWAALSAMFFGTEYSDGTMRNKIIAGHSRTAIYLASFITASAAAAFITLAGALGGIIGLFHFGGFEMGWSQYFVCMAVFLFTAVSASAIFTAFQINISNRAVSVIALLSLALAITIAGSFLYNSLTEPEMISGYEMTSDGIKLLPPHNNPAYIGGTLRQIYQFLLLLIPTGPQILIANGELTQPGLSLLLAAAAAVVFSALGALLFRKKDIK